jgi:zinc-ribbon domain
MRYCPNCGTEVDDTAVFCPTCGQPIDQAAEVAMPAAPAWPDGPADVPARQEWTEVAATRSQPDRAWAPPPAEDVTRVERQPAMAPSRPDPGAAPDGPPAVSRGPSVDLPITAPVTLTGWLIGLGTLLAAVGIVIGLFDGVLNPIELILLLALVAIAATVFVSASLPAIPNLRLITLVVALIGFGIAIDRLMFGGAGAGELLLFLGTAMAALGAVLLELGHDQPLGTTR